MSGRDHWPITVRNMDSVEFLVCSRGCPWRPRDRFPLNDHRTLSTFLYTIAPWDLDKVQDLVLNLDQARVGVHWKRQYVKRPDLDRMKEALDRHEILVYSAADPDEAALKALREKIQLVLTEILTQERAEAARLKAEHSNRSSLEKVGAHVAAGARGLGQAGLTFLTWVKDVYEVVSIHERQRRMMQAAWETYNSDSDDWVETFKDRMIAAEHKEVVEALGFDPLKVDRKMLAEAYEIANLVWEDEKTQEMLVTFAEDYARAQHSLEWTNIAGGAAFEIILTVVLTVFTGGVGTAAMFGSKARLLRPVTKLGELFEELAKLRRRVKLRKTKGKGSAGGKPSSLEDYVTNEPVPRPEPPPKATNQHREQKKNDSDDSRDENSNATSTPDRLDEYQIDGFNPYDNPRFKDMSPSEQKAFLKEYDKQLRAQQDAINDMTANEFKIARDAFKNQGRNPDAEAMQRRMGRQFERDVAASIREDLINNGMDRKAATALAKERAKQIKSNLAALHEPDMVAGGWTKPQPVRMGSTNVNSSIGASWPSRLPELDEMVNDAVLNGRGNAKLNVKLEILRGPGG